MEQEDTLAASKWRGAREGGRGWQWPRGGYFRKTALNRGTANESAPRSGVPAALLQVARGSAAEALSAVGSTAEGLVWRTAAQRLRDVGSNEVASRNGMSPTRLLLRRLCDPLNLMLLLLAGVSCGIHDYHAAAVIASMVLLSIALATFHEHRTGRAAQALRAMVHSTASVRRRDRLGDTGKLQEVPFSQLVPGDIVHLGAGDMVPADVRLLSCKDLFVNQAALTGESLPVEKFARDGVQGEELGALENVALMGTAVVSGTAIAVVVLTGQRAIFGRIADSIAEQEPETVFEQGLGRFARLMIGLIIVLAPMVFVINGVTKGDWAEALLFAMAVAVGLTPEMLPMLVTVNLAKGALAMSRRKVIVKHLSAIQNLGAMDVLCTDKTGTLTQDRVMLKRHIDLRGRESDRVLEFAFLNSHFQSGLRNLLDVAVLQHMELAEHVVAAGVYSLIDEVPFDFARRRMSVVLQGEAGRILICKGAVEEVFAACESAEVEDKLVPLDEPRRQELLHLSQDLNEDGFRVIAIACKELPPAAAPQPYSVADEAGLTLLGFIAFIDPPKESAAGALATLRAGGIEVKVLTGDSPIITRKVCKLVNMEVDRVVLGEELDGLDDDALGELAERERIFAKLTPAHKEALVRALRRRGRVVGVLGDGINDGPALKAGDVGISVDTGTDIAKESASIILLEKSLLVLNDGVLEGRKVFANLLKYLRMGASSNFGNMFSVLGASAWLPFLPMAPIQVLANNLLYDLSQTALPTDNVDAEALALPRRWEIGKIGRYILCVGPISSLFDYVTFAILFWVFGASTPAQASLFQTGWFLESLLSQTLVVHVIRTRKLPFLQSRPSTPLLLTTVGICAFGVWLPFSPLSGVLGLQVPPPAFWGMLVPILAAYLALTFAMRQWLASRIGID